MEGNLIILCGISGSGKSTYAHNLSESDPLNHVIINRDKIRELIFGYTENSISEYWSKKDIHKYEKEITAYEDVLIHEGLTKGKTVIVDATHLKRSYLERFKYWNVETNIVILFTSLQECIERNSKRSRQVDVGFIKKQYSNFKKLIDVDLRNNPIDFTPVSKFEYDSNKPDCIIFDIDGTLSEPGDRDIYSPEKAINDSTNSEISNIFNDLVFANDITESLNSFIVCTGRSESFKPVTEKWLANNYIKYNSIYFRKEKDFRPDWVVKEEMWREINKKYNITLIFEDRNQVVRRARALGLKVAHVKYGNY